ncbi:hypothetical protein TIFTF001_027192 [Ficus carica]|uniref:Uncharacterized protein n=1 Tax=Ficus carica TaxID=3494 RepID=A0AA88IZ88_FICCA|nr:hypothetical protein TIFTF001_027192 [Ficus carica]
MEGNWIREPIHLRHCDLSDKFSPPAQAKSSLKFLRSPDGHDGPATIVVSRQLGPRTETRCRLAATENHDDRRKVGDFLSSNDDFEQLL